MRIFVSGTDTDVGKTLVCAWLCLQTGYDYFKPVQTGIEAGTDSEQISALAGVRVHAERYRYPGPFSPHWSAALQHDTIDADAIALPCADRLIVEGAGGLLVPLNDKTLMIDLIQRLQLPVILVVRSALGTINHTLLSLEALRHREIPVLGVVMNGEPNPANEAAIQHYGRVPLLAVLPRLPEVSRAGLQQIGLPPALKSLLE